MQDLRPIDFEMNSRPADHGKSNLRVTSSDDAERIKPKETLANGNNRASNTKLARNIPRRHTVGGARSSKEILGMQPSEMDRKREAFLEHLKQKYPHHATAIMGQQERLKEQSRSPKHLRSSQPGLGEQAEHLSVASADSFEAMAEPEAPHLFNRGTRLRASLPVVRSTNQTKDRSLGVLYLQYGDEMTQFTMPNEITSMDTVHALFVRAFPKQLTMKMLESQNVAVYIKDEARNVFYELTDLRNIQDRALLKVYHKDPAHISFNHSSRALNGDVRMQREMVYTKEAPPSFRHHGPLPHGPPNSPPIAQSMPPSPSRIPYNGGRTIPMPGSATVPRDRLSSVPPSRSISPSPSAILERRDVKPDEDLSGKNIPLFRNEGLYADPYMYHDGRMSIASSSAGIPGDVPDHMLYHRPSLRSGNPYPSTSGQTDMMEQSMYRTKPRKYSDGYAPAVSSKTPPPSPQKLSEMRTMDIHGQGIHMAHPTQLDRSSSMRNSLRKDSGPPMVTETAVIKSRSAASSPSISDVVPFSADKQMAGYSGATGTPNDPETRERMKAMEKQIASLTGLVQSALFKGGSGAKENPSEKLKVTPQASISDTQGATSTISGVTLESSGMAAQPSASCQQQIQNNVYDLRRNIHDLRLQLQQLRQSQLTNQETLKAMFKKAESEINGRVIEAVRRAEDPLQRQRILVEEERQKYLADEEKIIQQLCGLEKSIDGLNKDASSAQQMVTLKDVEEGAVALRHVGESLAGLKVEFPTLQNKMRAVLRVEVEAVKFLKEEPHKLESLLKRVKSMTEVLTSLRRHVTEDLLRGAESPRPSQTSNIETTVTAAETEISKDSPLRVQEPAHAAQATLPLSTSSTLTEAQNSLVKSESHLVVHHVQSSPVLIHQSHHSSALVHPTQSPLAMPKQPHSVLSSVQPQLQISPAVVKPSQESADGVSQTQSAAVHQFQSPPSSAQAPPGQNIFFDEIQAATNTKKGIHRKMTIEAAEKEWEEKRQNMNQYDEKEFERLLEEAQANMMKGIPSLEVEPEQKPTAKSEEVDGIKQLEEVPLFEAGNEKPIKSPPPPPPRRSYPPGSGLTTARSGEVILTAKKESSPVTSEENSPVLLKSPRSPVEVKDLTLTSAPIAASAIKEDEDEGNRIMAELQAFQKCSLMDVSSKTVVEHPKVELQARDVRSTTLSPPKEKKQRPDTFGEQVICTENEYKAVLDSKMVSCDTTMASNVFVFHNQPALTQMELQPQNENPLPSSLQKKTTKYLDEEEKSVLDQAWVAIQSVENKEDVTLVKELMPAIKTDELIVKIDTKNGLQDFDSAHGADKSVCTSISISEEVVGQSLHPKLKKTSIAIPLLQSTKVLDQHDSFANKCEPFEWEMPTADMSTQKENYSQQVVLRQKPLRNVTIKYLDDVESSSSSGEESPTSDNIAFMITNTEVQALSSGEVNEIVNKKGESIQTVNVDANQEMTAHQDSYQEAGQEDSVLFMDRKPVIIIFDEPMDIRSAYKRLSTVFEECDEELEKIMAEEKIEEENEESETSNLAETLEEPTKISDEVQLKSISPPMDSVPSLVCDKTNGLLHLGSAEVSEPKESKSGAIEGEDPKSDCVEGGPFANKADNKKKFKFKFPKKQFAALTQAIKTGTKTGKKTLQVVVYEDEEELDGTVKQHKEAKRFEIEQSKSKDEAPEPRQLSCTDVASNPSRTDQIRKNTYKTLNSLEQTIKQLETTISEMSPKMAEEKYTMCPSNISELSQGPVSWDESKSTDYLLHSTAKATHTTKTKPPLLPKISTKSSEQQGSSLMSPASRMPVSVGSKLRQQQGNTEKVTKQKLQDAQRQFRQANGSAKKPGGETKATSPTLPASKIPALSPGSGKSSSVSGSSNESTNHPSTSSKHPLSTANSLAPTSGRNAQVPSVSHIPSTSNGSLKLHAHSPAIMGRGQPLSFPNGRPSSSSSSSCPSPVSPTSLTQGAKSIRTIHTASFASYKQQNINPSKSTVKETA
ncbi:sickle tail protein isoform X3 [Pristis pectinata]|uniref:sickle tail protein isoform X3 n=1 Tax=Pristis pectinata TaxID=685728 RepID=UPI00223D9405|nr:sickle tail protein isoform X3 [Pristis pectinata]